MSTEQIIFRDAFDGTLDSGWSWLRERPDDWRVQNGGLEICVRPGVKDTVQNALLRPAPDRGKGDYAIEVTIANHTHPTQQYEQAGITWYHNGEPVFKEVKELIDGDLYIIPGKKPVRTQSVACASSSRPALGKRSIAPRANPHSKPRLRATFPRRAMIKSVSNATTARKKATTGYAFQTFASNACKRTKTSRSRRKPR